MKYPFRTHSGPQVIALLRLILFAPPKFEKIILYIIRSCYITLDGLGIIRV